MTTGIRIRTGYMYKEPKQLRTQQPRSKNGHATSFLEKDSLSCSAGTTRTRTASFRDSGQALALGNLSYPSRSDDRLEVDMNVNFPDYV